MAKKQFSTTAIFDPAIVKQYASGRWAEILSALGGVPLDLLDESHHPCPKCGGEDRFRLTNRDGDGSAKCNQCFSPGSGDGLGTLEWLRACKFAEALRLVAEHLGVEPTRTASRGGKADRGERADPEEHLEPVEWNQALAGLWCLRKPPITPAAVQAAGGRLARYRRQYTVIDLPVIGESGKIVGHAIYNVTGGTLPKYVPKPGGSGKDRFEVRQVKTKLTHGSRPGLIGTVGRLESAEVVWKVEGCTDVLALLSLSDLPPAVAVITNANGAGERPKPWMLAKLAGKTVYVVGDADRPGVAGAAMWAAEISAVAKVCRLVTLPYEVAENHGKDVRDWIQGIDT